MMPLMIPNGAPFEANGPGYGLTDYGATCYTDIDPQGQTGQIGCDHRLYLIGTSSPESTACSSRARPGSRNAPTA